MRSPYLEVSFCDLNTQTVEQTVVEVNPFYRFFDIFSEILDINQKGYEKTREIFVDTVFHYLALTDLRMGRTEMVCLFYNLFFTGWHRLVLYAGKRG